MRFSQICPTSSLAKPKHCSSSLASSAAFMLHWKPVLSSCWGQGTCALGSLRTPGIIQWRTSVTTDGRSEVRVEGGSQPIVVILRRRQLATREVYSLHKPRPPTHPHHHNQVRSALEGQVLTDRGCEGRVSAELYSYCSAQTSDPGTGRVPGGAKQGNQGGREVACLEGPGRGTRVGRGWRAWVMHRVVRIRMSLLKYGSSPCATHTHGTPRGC